MSGTEEKLQRVLYKLICRRGGFAPYPKLGSRLYELMRTKPAERDSAARQFILEALENESDITLEYVQTAQNGDTLSVDIGLGLDGESKNIELVL